MTIFKLIDLLIFFLNWYASFRGASIPIEETDKEITRIQLELPKLEKELYQLMGYRQALIEMEEDNKKEEPE